MWSRCVTCETKSYGVLPIKLQAIQSSDVHNVNSLRGFLKANHLLNVPVDCS